MTCFSSAAARTPSLVRAMTCFSLAAEENPKWCKPRQETSSRKLLPNLLLHLSDQEQHQLTNKKYVAKEERRTPSSLSLCQDSCTNTHGHTNNTSTHTHTHTHTHTQAPAPQQRRRPAGGVCCECLFKDIGTHALKEAVGDLEAYLQGHAQGPLEQVEQGSPC